MTRAAAVAIALVALSRPVAAQVGDELAVALTIAPCARVDAAEVERLFRIELGTSAPAAAAATRADTTRVEVSCAQDLVELTVHDPVTGKSLTRRIALGAAAGRERLLALAVTELVVASWIELEATPQPAVPAADTRAPPTARLSARRVATKRLPKRTTWGANTSLLGAIGLGSAGAQAGAGLRVAVDGTSGFGWAVDLVGLRNEDEVLLGTVEASSVSGGLSAHAWWRAGSVRTRLALGARLGAAILTGAGNAPDVREDQVTGLSGGPFARATAAIELVAGLTAALSIEPGYHLFPVRARVDGATTTEIEGPWLTTDLSVGWAW